MGFCRGLCFICHSLSGDKLPDTAPGTDAKDAGGKLEEYIRNHSEFAFIKKDEIDKDTDLAVFMLPKDRMNNRRSIPVTESLNYSGEVHNQSRDRGTIYILEHVSESIDTKIIY